MIVECLYCKSKVDGKVIASHESFGEHDPFPFRATLLECPVCKNSLLAGQELIQIAHDKYEWDPASRLWPKPEKYLDFSIPEIVRNSLSEANKCYKAQAYTACAVMCGRALEGICAEYGVNNKLLAGGLKALLDKKIIDSRIYEWGQALRKYRNIGAHASDKTISKEDAMYLLDFANAICEYVFVLSSKFENFMQKKQK